MSSSDADMVLTTVAELASAQMPLAEGLRAAAADARGSVASGLRTLAAELEAGRTVEQACANPNLQLPPHVRGMVEASIRTGQLGPALDELLEHQRSIRKMHARIWMSLAYPLIVFLLNLLVLGFLLCYVVPVFKELLLDFELRLPVFTHAVIAVSDAAVWLILGPGQTTMLGLALGIVVFLVLAATGKGGATVQRLVIESAPILGPLWHWSGAAAFTYLLGSLVDKHIPLAEALRLTARATKKADLRQSGEWLADQVSQGRSLGDLVESSACLPVSAVPLLRWGERTNALPEALRLISEILTERVQMRADWLRSVAPPFVYVFIGLSAAAVVAAIFLPLVTLIGGLA